MTPPANPPAEPAKAKAIVPHVEAPPLEGTIVYRIGRIFCQIIVRVMFDFQAYGTQHIPRTGGVLIVSNHESYLDPVMVAVGLRRAMSYMAKSELFENRYLSWLIRSLHAFPVRQGEGDVSAVRETISRLKEGYMLNIFPEGSRTETGELLPIQPGVALVARRADVPIVPCALFGTFRSWPKGRRFPRLTRIRVKYGPPLNVKGMKSDAIVAAIDQSLRSLLNDLRSANSTDACRAVQP